MKDNASIVIESVQPSNLIGKFVKLKPLNSKTFLGLCPFHNEKTPSFRVHDDKKFFYCFGCNKGGNILNFMQDYKGFSFTESLNEIATLYGIKLLKQNSSESKKFQDTKNLLQEISSIFEKYLHLDSGKEAFEYLTKKRKLTQDSISNFNLGFCPAESDFLISHFPDKIEELLNLGLIKKQENGSFYNPFADRIIFPIKAKNSQVIGFGSRIYKKSQESANLAKYVNSKESDFFKKSKIIYGIEKLEKTGEAPIIVEGYLDVIIMHQFGFKSAVAQMGTAFSEDQINILFSISNDIIFCYDSDDAGKKAEKRSINLCLPHLSPTKNLFFINLEEKDPDEFLQKNGALKMRQKLEEKVPLYQKIFDTMSENIDFKNPNQASLTELNLMKFCENFKDEILKKNYISYFKNQIFLKKRGVIKHSKTLKNELQIEPRDGILFSLFCKFPEFFKTEYYFEKFVPFKNKTLENFFKEENFNLELKNTVLNQYPISESITKENLESLYNKIYLDFLREKLNEDRERAAESGDFQKVKIINQELGKLKI